MSDAMESTFGTGHHVNAYIMHEEGRRRPHRAGRRPRGARSACFTLQEAHAIMCWRARVGGRIAQR